jgi:hypothetical protein
MPRPKTTQPSPYKIYEFPDLLIEVRDRKTQPIGRGLHNRQGFVEITEKILDFASRDYFKFDPSLSQYINKPDRTRDYLKSAASFARKCELEGIPRETSSLRKRYYYEVLNWIAAVTQALDAALSGTAAADRTLGIASLSIDNLRLD